MKLRELFTYWAKFCSQLCLYRPNEPKAVVGDYDIWPNVFIFDTYLDLKNDTVNLI